MKALRGFGLFCCFALLLVVSGCVVAAGPTVYVPAPPPACPDGYYWSSGYGCVPLPAGIVVAPDAAYAVVNINYLSLRSCPTTKCGILASLELGEQVQVLGQEGGWTHVWAYARGQDGWVASKYLN